MLKRFIHYLHYIVFCTLLVLVSCETYLIRPLPTTLLFNDIQIGYFRYRECRFADEVQPWIDTYKERFMYCKWSELTNEPFPSPTLLIQAEEIIWLYSGVNEIKSAFLSHPFFQFNNGYLPLKLIK